MIAVEIDISVELLAELEDEIPCGNPLHNQSQNKCRAEEYASYVMLNPCCGDRACICWSRANYLKNHAAEIHCNSCGKFWPPSAYRFIPIRPGVEPI